MRAMLDAHPDIRCGQETRVIPNLLTALARWEKPGHKHLLDLAGVTREVLNNAVGAFIGVVIEQHGSKANMYCDKDPMALLMMPRLAEIFPHSKFIMMIRDGRASVHSMITRNVSVTGFDRSNKKVRVGEYDVFKRKFLRKSLVLLNQNLFILINFQQMLEAWSKMINRMYQNCQHLGPQVCLPVHYEKLVISPRDQMKKITDFIGVSFSENTLEHEKHIGDEIRLSP